MIEWLASVKMQQIHPINNLAYFQIYPFSSNFEAQFFGNDSCFPYCLTQNKRSDELLKRERDFAL